jgi:hypothetical protein
MSLLSTMPARSPASRQWRIALGLALAACAASVSVAVRAAFGRATPVQSNAGTSQLGGNQDREARGCARCSQPRGSAPFMRTRLYFGSNKPDGSVVTQEQFQYFLDREVTPRFPGGVTLMTGIGQFLGSNAVIQRERSTQLLVLYPSHLALASARKIEEIRSAYKRLFQQESVLRADEPQPQCVSF